MNEKQPELDDTERQQPRATPAAAALVASSNSNPAQLANSSAAPLRPREPVGGLAAIHSVRRRWPQMLCAGVVGAVILAGGAWFYFQPKFHTYASLRIHSETPRLAFEVEEAGQAAQFEIYKRTQRELVLGDEVLIAALRSSKLAEAPIMRTIALSEDPVIWLRNLVRVDFPGNAEIMVISMEGDNPAFIADTVNSVLDAYVVNVIDAGKRHRSDRLVELRKVQGVQEEKARRLRNKLETLTESLGSGDSEALSVKQQVAIQRFAQLQTEHTRVQFDRLGAELKLARIADRLSSRPEKAAEQKPAENADEVQQPGSPAGGPSELPPIAAMTPAELDAIIQRDGAVVAQRDVVRQAVLTLEEVVRRVGNDKTSVVSQFQSRVDQENEVLSKLEDLARENVVQMQAQQAALFARDQHLSLIEKHEQLQGEVKTLQLHEKLLAEFLTKATQEADKIGTSSVNVELTKNELDRLEKINDRIGVEIETLTIELSSASRVEPLGRARRPLAAGKEDRWKKTVTFGLLGFLVPCAGLIWLDLRRKVVNGEADIEQLATLRLLGSVPIVPPVGYFGQRHERGALALREAVDCIRTVLIREAELSDYRIIQITSAIGGEAKTTFASQLARSLARANRRTVLVDFDVRSPSVHDAVGTRLEAGTCELLRGERTIEDVLRPTEQEDLWLVFAGRCDRLALTALTNCAVDNLLTRLRERFEFVIVDSSPVLPVVDALLVAQRSDATILTALRDVSLAPQMEEARDRLRQVGANVIGSVVTTAGVRSYYETQDRYAVV
jgi:capsular exopolysaccharide synthesis family protein